MMCNDCNDYDSLSTTMMMMMKGSSGGSSSFMVNGFCYNNVAFYGGGQLVRTKNIQSKKTTMRWNTIDDEDSEDGILNDDNNNNNNDDENDNDIKFYEQVDTIPDLSWRVEKLRLEEANTRRFLKSKPRFLPYDECRKWVMAWNRWDSEEEWKNWIDEGEKRNSYIPARPDEYYGRLGQWKGWDHFLGKEVDEKKGEEDGDDYDMDATANDFQ